MARRFLGLANLDGAFERVTRYEFALWRQVRQTVFTLDGLQRRRSGRRYGGLPYGWQASEARLSDENTLPEF